ncbi:MAG TPA: Hpt domain-containing protein [Bdellovibrionota bacterium]|nr:Hpt domain-containing protein [Bdellovibrionota bacterium]
MTPFDSSVLEELKQLEGDRYPTLLQDLLELYVDWAPGVVAKIEEAVKTQDHPTLESEAHSLKSSSGNLGATKLQQLCHDLEKCGVKHDQAGAERTFVLFKSECQKVVAAAQALLAKY